jgi:hypothetical protein
MQFTLPNAFAESKLLLSTFTARVKPFSLFFKLGGRVMLSGRLVGLGRLEKQGPRERESLTRRPLAAVAAFAQGASGP